MVTGEVKCPRGGVCPLTCRARQVSEGLQQWIADHPVPQQTEGLTFNERRKLKATAGKAAGTIQYMTQVACGVTRNDCLNKIERIRKPQ